MTDNNHPTNPPPELVEQWIIESRQWIAAKAIENRHPTNYYSATDYAIAKAARWGADQELEECVEWLGDSPVVWRGDPEQHPGFHLREARRPKPSSLKEQALEALNEIEDKTLGLTIQGKLIRRALEALPS